MSQTTIAMLYDTEHALWQEKVKKAPSVYLQLTAAPPEQPACSCLSLAISLNGFVTEARWCLWLALLANSKKVWG